MRRGFHFLAICVGMAWSNLRHRPRRTLSAIAGLAFAILLIFLQLGFIGSAEESACLVPEHLDFDLLIVSSQFVDMNRPGWFSRHRVDQAENAPGVERAVGVYVGLLKYRNPQAQNAGDRAGIRRNMTVLGVNAHQHVFRLDRLPDMAHLQTQLVQPDAILFDLGSRDQFVIPDGTEDAELGGEKVRVVGTFTMGTGFGADGVAVLGQETFCRLTQRDADTINLGLVRLRSDTDYSAQDVQAFLRQTLPDDVRVWTRDEIRNRLQRHWVWQMPIGIIFVFGTCVALVVGVVFGYQVVSSDVSNRLKEFATLKALGYTNGHLTTTVVLQAQTLSVVAYVLALGLALGGYELLQWQAKIPMGMDVTRGVGVFVASLVMCSLAAWLALGRVKTADPANLF
jgi:putative ABC transport system permease protein